MLSFDKKTLYIILAWAGYIIPASIACGMHILLDFKRSSTLKDVRE